MQAVKHIVVPFDFSERATAMVGYALRIAERFRAKATILHVLEVPPDVPVSPFPDAYRLLGVTEDLIHQHEKRLRSFEFPFSVPQDVKRLVIRGEAANAILEWSHHNHADLIAMPTRGHGVLRRFLLGSVCAKVLDGAEAPVITAAHTRELATGGEIRKVLCAVDLTDHSAKTLRYASDFCGELGAELHVAHSVEVDDMREALNFGTEWEHKAIERAKERIHTLQGRLDVVCDIHIRVGEPVKIVPHLAETLGADLLVLGRSVKGNAGSFLRTNAYALIRESPCAVLSV